MAIETSRFKKYKPGRQDRKPRFSVLAAIIIILVLLPVVFYFTDPSARMSFINYQIGRANEKLNRITSAKRYYGASFEASEKQNQQAHLKFAQMCNRLEQYSDALKVTNQIIETKPVDEIFMSDVYLEQGLANEGMEYFDDAFVSYTKSVKLNAESYFALIALGRINRIKGIYNDSKQHLENAVELRRLRAPEAHYELGLTYLAENNAADALDEFDLVLSQLPPKKIKQKAQEKKLEIISNRK